MSFFKKKTVTTVVETVKVSTEEPKKENSMDKVAPKSIGRLDMVIAFDTTGSMASYIGAVRQEVAELIPRLFKDNDDQRPGIVAFGDYCDMENAHNFGKAYQCMPITNNESLSERARILPAVTAMSFMNL